MLDHTMSCLVDFNEWRNMFFFQKSHRQMYWEAAHMTSQLPGGNVMQLDEKLVISVIPPQRWCTHLKMHMRSMHELLLLHYDLWAGIWVTQFGWSHFFTVAMKKLDCLGQMIWGSGLFHWQQQTWKRSLGSKWENKSGCFLCSSTLLALAPTHSYSAHIRLLSQCTSHVSYSRLTVWDGLSAFSHQLCHGVHVVQNSVVPFCSPPILCSTLQVQDSTVWVQTSKVHFTQCSAAHQCVFTPAPPWDPTFPTQVQHLTTPNTSHGRTCVTHNMPKI